jgi:Pyridoxamine 5'-phosphate oxidase
MSRVEVWIAAATQQSAMSRSSFSLFVSIILALLLTTDASDAVRRHGSSGNDEEEELTHSNQGDQVVNDRCPCHKYETWKRPDVWKKAETARWMVHSIEWGVLNTLSSREISPLEDDSGPVAVYPFGNVYSFIDGPCDNATGTPYFYGSFLDQSLKDMLRNPVASLTLSEASLASSQCHNDDDATIAKACSISLPNVHDDPSSHTRHSEGNEARSSGDPESPLCARLTLSGTLVQVPTDSHEFQSLQTAFFQRHAQMATWPSDHDWVIVALQIKDVWLIDYFGGATVLTPDQYYALQPPFTRDSNG